MPKLNYSIIKVHSLEELVKESDDHIANGYLPIGNLIILKPERDIIEDAKIYYREFMLREDLITRTNK